MCSFALPNISFISRNIDKKQLAEAEAGWGRGWLRLRRRSLIIFLDRITCICVSRWLCRWCIITYSGNKFWIRKFYNRYWFDNQNEEKLESWNTYINLQFYQTVLLLSSKGHYYVNIIIRLVVPWPKGTSVNLEVLEGIRKFSDLLEIVQIFNFQFHIRKKFWLFQWNPTEVLQRLPVRIFFSYCRSYFRIFCSTLL